MLPKIVHYSTEIEDNWEFFFFLAVSKVEGPGWQERAAGLTRTACVNDLDVSTGTMTALGMEKRCYRLYYRELRRAGVEQM